MDVVLNWWNVCNWLLIQCLESGERRGGVKKGVKEEFHIKKQKKIECGKMRKGCTQYNGPNFFSQSSHYLSFIFTDVLF